MRRLLPALLPAVLGAAGCTLPPPYPQVVPASGVGMAGRPYDLIGPYDAAPAPRRFDARPLPPPSSGPLDLVPFDSPAPPPRSAGRPDPDLSDPDTAPPPAATAATGSAPRSERPAAQPSSAPVASPTPASTTASRNPTEERGAERSSAVPLEGFRPLGGVSRRSQLSH